MKYYLIAGEASGDLHGGNLIREIRARDPQARIRCWGGDRMEAAGGEVVKHYRELAFMGFAEVIQNLGTILRNLKRCKEDVASFAPDVLVLIDYPGFNLRIAEWAKAGGMKVLYYISPQVWAWKEGRVKKIRRVVDKMLVILPFESDFYKKHSYEVEYVGHPLMEVVDEFLSAAPPLPSGGPVLALLPGSRKQEVLKKLPLMLEAIKEFPDARPVLAKAPSLDDAFYAPLLAAYPQIEAVRDGTYPLLAGARAALVTSGTATLETALFGVPQVVCYKGSPVSYAIARRLVKIKYISLVNLIMDKPVVQELIQHELTVPNIRRALREVWEDGPQRQSMLDDYAALREVLSGGGGASGRAAAAVISLASGAA